jgi:hypothetical protein
MVEIFSIPFAVQFDIGNTHAKPATRASSRKLVKIRGPSNRRVSQVSTTVDVSVDTRQALRSRCQVFNVHTGIRAPVVPKQMQG